MNRMKNPSHPGQFIREEIIAAYGLTVTAGAKVLGVTRQALSELVNGRTSLTADMAFRLEKAFGFSIETLMRMQLQYEIAQARLRGKDVRLKRYHAAIQAA